MRPHSWKSSYTDSCTCIFVFFTKSFFSIKACFVKFRIPVLLGHTEHGSHLAGPRVRPDMAGEPASDVVRDFARESQAWRHLLSRKRAEAKKIVGQCQSALDGLRQLACGGRNNETCGDVIATAGSHNHDGEEQAPCCPPLSACAGATSEAPQGGPSLVELQKLTTELLREREELHRRMLELERKHFEQKVGVAANVQGHGAAPHTTNSQGDTSSLLGIEGRHGTERMLHSARRSAPEPGWQRVSSGNGGANILVKGSHMDFARHRRVRICKDQLKEIAFKHNAGWTHSDPGNMSKQDGSLALHAGERNTPDAVPYGDVYPAIQKALSARAKRLDRDPIHCTASGPAETLQRSALTPAVSSAVVASIDIAQGDDVVAHVKLAEEDEAQEHACADSRACNPAADRDCRLRGNGATMISEETVAADALELTTMPALDVPSLQAAVAKKSKNDGRHAHADSACGEQPVKQLTSTTELAVHSWQQQQYEPAACCLQTAARRILGASSSHCSRARAHTHTDTLLRPHTLRCCMKMGHHWGGGARGEMGERYAPVLLSWLAQNTRHD